MQILALHLQCYVNRETNIAMENIKEEARKLIDKLPENSTWDDLMYQIYIRQTIEAGLADSKAGKVTSVQEVRRKFGLPE
jgi:predicted transcriptional regulator